MRSFHLLHRLLELLLVLLLAFMVIAVFANVVLRYAFHSGIASVEELSRFAFVWATFIGGVILMREQGHLGFDSLSRKLGPNGQLACKVLSDVLIIGVALFLAWGGWQQLLANLGKHAQVSGLPMAWFFAVGPVAGILMALYALEDLACSLRSVRTGKARPTIQAKLL